MQNAWWGIVYVLACLLVNVAAIYNPIREHVGATFFDRWAYYGNVDNTTWGNVTFLDQADATAQRLTFVNNAGNAIVKVDNTTTILPAPLVNRNSIRLTSLDSYGLGSLIIIDALHIPYGCSVWPSFWTYGIEETWPGAGEIDIIEAINDMDHNQVALHTLGGCFQETNPVQSGTTLGRDCSTGQGCLVAETKPNSFGAGFAQAGGGVYALQLEATGISSWFWSRADIPANVLSATSTSTIDTTSWGIPTASYTPSGCNITQFFPPQNLVLLTTLCGVWAGVPSIYSSTCKTRTNSCVNDNIIGDGSNYANAYWEIRYIRTYLSDDATVVSSSSSSSSSSLSSTSSAPSRTDSGGVASTIQVVVTPSSSSSPTPTTHSSSTLLRSSPWTLSGLVLSFTATLLF